MGEWKGRIPLLVLLGVIAVVTGTLLGRSGAHEPPGAPVEAHVDTTSTSPFVSVHVSGMVVSPGVVDVPDGAIVADVIDAAGGLLTGARVDQINLAATVSAGDHIVVPGPDTEAADGGGPSGDDGPLSLNSASVSDFETLPGVGPVLAERIVSYRDSEGRFETVEDLLQVPGIGEAKLAAIRDLVRP